ncbi:hypothetical protein Nepgr_002516 [Nepenthes gracilis]|uniref:Protein SCAI n=1 Tax=Nepenthes gracilis TaxID=150966 RepID=A0AAD3RWY7_NEPGR|nr:hypothetical protein Nepgr_002516 [Nepenthes gracilis]
MAQQNSSNIPLIEVYWSLVDKADKKFAKIRDLPLYERNRYDTYFYKVFKVYTQLWKFQQENRQRLVESGLKRWEIGEIASRISQLYFGQYMRTSEASYLSESYVFYEAIMTREYFKEGLSQDLNIAHKQLRFLARFIMVCLLLNRREMVHQLANQLKILLDECRRTYQEMNFREWKLMVQEINKFLKADTAFMNIRPLRYSLALDAQSDSLPHASASHVKRIFRLCDAILSSYHSYEVKFSELTLDTYRMLQCLEWEPSGSFYKLGATSPCGTSASYVKHSQDITDPTLPPNPRKAVLYRPSATHFMAVLATACEELPSDGVLLIYLSGKGGRASLPSSGAGGCLTPVEAVADSLQSWSISSDASSTHDSRSCSCGQINNACLNCHLDCVHIGSLGNEGMNCIYPCDLLPFTRKPLFIVIDSESSGAFKNLSGAEKGELAAMLLSPNSTAPIAVADSSRQISGSLFTSFLTTPVQAFCLLLGFSGSDIDVDLYDNAERLLSSALNNWGGTLATSGSLNPVWAQVLCDPFLRRIILRFIFCRAVLTLYAPTFKKAEFVPQCMPSFPEFVLPTAAACQSVVMQMASVFGAANSFIFSEETIPSEGSPIDKGNFCAGNGTQGLLRTSATTSYVI